MGYFLFQSGKETKNYAVILTNRKEVLFPDDCVEPVCKTAYCKTDPHTKLKG